MEVPVAQLRRLAAGAHGVEWLLPRKRVLAEAMLFGRAEAPMVSRVRGRLGETTVEIVSVDQDERYAVQPTGVVLAAVVVDRRMLRLAGDPERTTTNDTASEIRLVEGCGGERLIRGFGSDGRAGLY